MISLTSTLKNKTILLIMFLTTFTHGCRTSSSCMMRRAAADSSRTTSTITGAFITTLQTKKMIRTTTFTSNFITENRKQKISSSSVISARKTKNNFPYFFLLSSSYLSSSATSSSSSSSSSSINNLNNYITTKGTTNTSTNSKEFHNQVDQESNSINYPKGIPTGFYIIQHYNVPNQDILDTMLEQAIIEKSLETSNCNDSNSSDSHSDSDSDSDTHNSNSAGITQEELDRLGISNGANITLPIALMLLDPIEYPSFSKARKACRKGYIIIHRGPLDNNNDMNAFDNEDNENNNNDDGDDIIDLNDVDNDTLEQGEKLSKQNNNHKIFNLTKMKRGRVADRVYPNDVIARQVRMHGGFYPGLAATKPPFDLPVVYEDDHFAIVNKPAGVVVYSQKNQGHGLMTIRSALPFALKPPKRGTLAIIRRPVSVHRLDKPTSGLLLIAKTKPAMIDLTKQFVERRVKKTYTAIVNGIPCEPIESSISMLDAHNMGVDVGYSSSLSMEEVNSRKWQLIDYSLDDGRSVKSATTVWRPLQYAKSLKAKDGILTKVELKPKTGRYHQLRRHMAWVKDCPLVGDNEYDGGGDAMSLRGRGLFLCSNKVLLDHPYWNTEIGRKEWEKLPDEEKWANGIIQLNTEGDREIIQVSASIDLPNKFASLLKSEEERANKFANENNSKVNGLIL